MNAFDPGEFAKLPVAGIDEYFRPLAIHEATLRSLVEHANSIDIDAHVRSRQPEADASTRKPGYTVTADGVAVIQLAGTLMKRASSLSSGTSTIRARQAIRSAARDDDVAAIVLAIDSPGGTAAGTMELADEVAAAARLKPVDAFIEDMGASAAYWVASQAQKVWVNATGMVGSIGTFAVLQDSSGMAAQLGVKVHVVRAGELKGAGQPGTEVTPELLAEVQSVVDALNEQFLQAVASGRNMNLDRVRQLADGRVHVGAAAHKIGLVDGVRSFEQVVQSIANEAVRKGARNMAETKTEVAGAIESMASGLALSSVATYQEIAEECVGADAEFICAQLKDKVTIEQARRSWMAEQQKQIEAARAEADQVKTAKPAAAAGVDPVTSGSAKAAVDGNAAETWNAEVQKLVATGTKHQKACSLVNRRHHGLREQMVAEYNEEHVQRVA